MLVMLFLENYFVVAESEALRAEISTFMTIEDMTMSEYLAKFTQLARFAPQIMLTEAENALKFQLILLPIVGGRFALDSFPPFAKVLQMARMFEKRNITTRKNWEAFDAANSDHGLAKKKKISQPHAPQPNNCGQNQQNPWQKEKNEDAKSAPF